MENDGERNVYHLEAKRKKHHLHLSGRDVEEGFREDMPARSPPYNEAPSCYLWASQVALAVNNPAANAGDAGNSGSIPGSGRSPGEGHGNPLHGNSPIAWRIPWTEEPGGLPVHGNAKSRATNTYFRKGHASGFRLYTGC